MTLETREEEEILAKIRLLDPDALKAIWAVKGTVGAIEAAVKSLAAKVDSLEIAIKALAVESKGALAAANAPQSDSYSAAHHPVT
jgi:hypothetical protein